MSQVDLFGNVVSHISPSYQEDFPVSRSLVPGSEEARMMTVTSGRRCLELCRSSNQLGLLEKMLVGSSIWNSTIRLLTWRVKVTKSGRSLFQLAVSEPSTNGNGALLWHTPDTMCGLTFKSQETMDKQATTTRKGRKEASNLRDQVAVLAGMWMWPTPRSRDGKGMSQRGINAPGDALPNMIGALIPTPNSVSGNQDGRLGEWGGRGNKFRKSSLSKGLLNPAFVEELMLFPIGWTDLKPSEMPLSRRKSTRSSKRSTTSKPGAYE